MGEAETVVTAIFRYPVKAMGGEELGAVDVDARGLVGDRGWALHEADGLLSTGKNGRRFRRRDGVFELCASLPEGAGDHAPRVVLPGGAVVVGGTPEADAALAAHVGAPVRLCPESHPGEHYDDAPVSLVGTATLAAAGDLTGAGGPLDVRRFRANLLLDTTEPFVEEAWVGRVFAVGGVVLEGIGRVTRCRMVDVAQVGLPARRGVLRALGAERDARLAIYARVVRPGRIAVGDAVRLASAASSAG